MFQSKKNRKPTIAIIAAVAKNGAIGFQNKLLYRLPNDMRRFKTLTEGHTVIMGRKTYLSLPKKPLPNRRNIVLTRSKLTFPSCETFASLSDAIAHCSDEELVFIIGGASVYRDALEYADTLLLTEIDDNPSNADTFFPNIKKLQKNASDAENAEAWKEIARENFLPDEKHAVGYAFVTYEKVH